MSFAVAVVAADWLIKEIQLLRNQALHNYHHNRVSRPDMTFAVDWVLRTNYLSIDGLRHFSSV